MTSILITGGTGTFGAAFLERALQEYGRVCVFSRGEHRQAELREQFPQDNIRWFIGDVRDRDRLRRAMEGCTHVVHAAALKRIEVGAYNPAEMVKTNVLGAMNVIEAAQDAGVGRVVALSTDKAWQPISPYGQSKALAESLFLSTNGSSDVTFVVVRYGNVAGSAGSVIPKWRKLIAAGARIVPVTDPDCTRFWMDVDDAVDTVGEALRGFTFDLHYPRGLPAYRLGDLAEAMGVEMEIRGLPDYEKMHEGMADGITSDVARRMTVEELRECLSTTPTM